MQRDGESISLWQNIRPPFKSGKVADTNILYDVIIAGGGITGITTALLLQKAGKKCLLIEAYNLCYGTTGGTTAHLNTLLDTPYTQLIKNFGEENAQLTAKAVSEAIRLIRKHVAEYNINCGFEEADAFLFSQNESQTKELQDIYEACKTVHLAVSFVDDLPVPVSFEKIMKIKHQAKFEPVTYVYALAEAFERAGGTIVENCRVNSAEENEVIDLETDLGKIQAKQLIYATHIPPGVNLLHLRCAPYRSYAMAVRLNKPSYPEGLIYDMYDPYHYYRTQKIKGKNYLIAGGEDHKTGHKENTNEPFLHLESHIKKHFDIAEISFKWSSQYFEPADGLPYIGHLPGHPGNIFVATGFGGNGMIYSHVAAIVLRDMIVNEEGKYISLFDPNRVKPIAGFANFVKENLDVVKQFIGKWFSNEKLDTLAEIAPGEGRVVKLQGHTIALYKDEHGILHAVNPVCTHLKCSVVWNAAERSWDCPCHGARYSADGKVLTGPADRDLELIELRSLAEA